MRLSNSGLGLLLSPRSLGAERGRIVWLARRIGAAGGIVRDERAPDAPEAER